MKRFVHTIAWAIYCDTGDHWLCWPMTSSVRQGRHLVLPIDPEYAQWAEGWTDSQ